MEIITAPCGTIHIDNGGEQIRLNGFEQFALYKFLKEKYEAKEEQQQSTNTADIMQEAVNTFKERNKVYGNNFEMVGDVMVAMFPEGVTLKTKEEFNKWHLFELKIVKLTRFAISKLTHIDSIHDDGVYSFMVERQVRKDG